jgi:hypothetical protein
MNIAVKAMARVNVKSVEGERKNGISSKPSSFSPAGSSITVDSTPGMISSTRYPSPSVWACSSFPMLSIPGKIFIRFATKTTRMIVITRGKTPRAHFLPVDDSTID